MLLIAAVVLPSCADSHDPGPGPGPGGREDAGTEDAGADDAGPETTLGERALTEGDVEVRGASIVPTPDGFAVAYLATEADARARIRFLRLDPTARPVEASVVVAEAEAHRLRLAARALAATPQGATLVVWSELSPDGSTRTFRAQRRDGAGRVLGDPWERSADGGATAWVDAVLDGWSLFLTDGPLASSGERVEVGPDGAVRTDAVESVAEGAAIRAMAHRGDELGLVLESPGSSSGWALHRIGFDGTPRGAPTPLALSGEGVVVKELSGTPEGYLLTWTRLDPANPRRVDVWSSRLDREGRAVLEAASIPSTAWSDTSAQTRTGGGREAAAWIASGSGGFNSIAMFGTRRPDGTFETCELGGGAELHVVGVGLTHHAALGRFAAVWADPRETLGAAVAPGAERRVQLYARTIPEAAGCSWR